MAFTAEFTNIGRNRATFSADFTEGDESFSRYRIVDLYVYKASDNSIVYESQVYSKRKGGSSSHFNESVDGLTQNTRYTWTARLGYEKNDDGDIAWLGTRRSGSFTTDAVITKWSWTSSNGSASADETARAYSVLNGKIPVYGNFSYKVWNDLVDKVSKMRNAKGYTWDSNGGTSQSGAKVSSGEVLTAKKFNSLKYNVGSVKGTYKDVSSGEQIFGWHFTKITDVLNEIIDEIE